MREAVTDSTPPATTEVRRHPIRGALWGILLGVGVTGLLVVYGVITLGTLTPYVVLACCFVFGILWGLFAPTKKAKGEPPAAAAIGDWEPTTAPLPDEPVGQPPGEAPPPPPAPIPPPMPTESSPPVEPPPGDPGDGDQRPLL